MKCLQFSPTSGDFTSGWLSFRSRRDKSWLKLFWFTVSSGRGRREVFLFILCQTFSSDHWRLNWPSDWVLRAYNDIKSNAPLSGFMKQLTGTLRRGLCERLMNRRCIQQSNRCCSPPVAEKFLWCPARDIWHPDVCHYSSRDGFQ